MSGYIQNFSKLSRNEKLQTLLENGNLNSVSQVVTNNSLVQNKEFAIILNELSENTISHFPTPYGIAPNFLINNKIYHIPMVTEESSVIAATAKAAKIWKELGGFNYEVKSTVKCGQVHFIFSGNFRQLYDFLPQIRDAILNDTQYITERMRHRGGGIESIDLIEKTSSIENYYQLFIRFKTANAMGANFINSCLETAANSLKSVVDKLFTNEKLEIIMSILSNYNPESIVKCQVECNTKDLENFQKYLSGSEYVRKFETAVRIAKTDIHRAVTHNKGIFNGIDAVAIATGNDYRAIEAGAHAYASRDGIYRSLSSIEIQNNRFSLSLELPLTVGTVGGITNLHPLTKLSFQILENPNSNELMGIMASVGLASNFAALNALITSGIQKGHMKLHLSNILNHLGANESMCIEASKFFMNKTISFSEVKKFIKQYAK